MPIREFECVPCDVQGEVIHPSTDPEKVPVPECPLCHKEMSIMWSVPHIDSSTSFNREGGGSFVWRGPTGLYHEIDSLHKLRQVEHSYLESGHDVRFDAWSAEPSNPDAIDGFGLEYHDGSKNYSKKRKIVSL